MSEEITIEKLKAVQGDLHCRHIKQLAAIWEGVKVMPDPTGMICGPNEYIIFVGGSLWEKLKQEETIK